MKYSLLLGLLFSLLSFSSKAQQSDFEISKNLDIYSTVYKQLYLHYVDEINIGELNQMAIEKMLGSLDPYTVYYPESQIEDVKYIRTGKYGGIGASVHIQNDTITVSSVLKDYPFYKAGIRAGDKLLKADDLSLIGKSTDEMSDILKGSAGSSLSMTYMDSRKHQTRQVEVVREEVKIDNIPYAGRLDHEIGYVRLSQFTETAAKEVADALSEMHKAKALNGLVFDLRGNGGGLLIQAVYIMDLFLQKDQLVVETKGKIPQENKQYHTQRPALYPDLPVVVLVNERSASAAEIVAGAFQDHDRGVIVGKKSFGKGLVQKVYPLSFNAQMKVTVAKYYIPSGRCIQEINYSDGKKRTADSLRGTFKTKGGRLVKDAGGILPDVISKEGSYDPIVYDLAKNHLIFNYATHYVNTHDSIKNMESFALNEKDFMDFSRYLKRNNYVYQSPAMQWIERISSDSSMAQNDSIQAISLELKELIKHIQEKQLSSNKSDILHLLEVEIISRYYFQKGRAQSSLRNDQTLQEGISILLNKERYSSLLKPEN